MKHQIQYHKQFTSVYCKCGQINPAKFGIAGQILGVCTKCQEVLAGNCYRTKRD